jgi:hypothetical protein
MVTGFEKHAAFVEVIFVPCKIKELRLQEIAV